MRRHRSLTAVDGGLDARLDAAVSEAGAAGFVSPESGATMRQVHTAVESLPEAQRLVMLLVCVEGCSYREAADVLDVPIGTVMSRLARARIAVGTRFLRSGARPAAGPSPLANRENTA